MSETDSKAIREKEEKSVARQDYEKGVGYLEGKNYTQAANALHNALLGFEQDRDEAGVANASDKLGDVCMGMDQYDKALEHYERAYGICDKNSDTHSLFYLERKKAKAYHAAGRLDEAITQYLGVIDGHLDRNDPKGAVESMETLAGIYLDKGEKAKAADCYRTIASIHKNFKHQNLHKEFMAKAEALADE